MILCDHGTNGNCLGLQKLTQAMKDEYGRSSYSYPQEEKLSAPSISWYCWNSMMIRKHRLTWTTCRLPFKRGTTPWAFLTILQYLRPRIRKNYAESAFNVSVTHTDMPWSRKWFLFYIMILSIVTGSAVTATTETKVTYAEKGVLTNTNAKDVIAFWADNHAWH